MTSNFPFEIHNLDATRGNGEDSMGPDGKDHALHHQYEDDTITALQSKVGTDDSLDTESLDFLTKNNGNISNYSIGLKGGVKNPEFLGSGSASQSSRIGDEKYGWYFTKDTITSSASYIPNGGITLNITTTGGDDRYAFIDSTNNQYSALMSNSSKFITLEIGAKYRFSVEYGVTGNSAGNLQAMFQEQNGDSSYILHNIAISGNTARTYKQIEFTATKKYGSIGIGYFGGAAPSDGTTMNIYKTGLEKIVEIGESSGTPTSPSIKISNDVSKYNIDQSQTLVSGRHEFADGVTYRIGQSFVPTQKYMSGITFQKGPNQGSPITDPKIYIQNDSGGVPGTVIAAVNITSAAWNSIPDNSDYFVDIPCILTPGSVYRIAFDAPQNSVNYRTINHSAGGGYSGGTITTFNGSTWSLGTNDIYFKTHYTKKLQNIDLKINGVKTSLSTDQDGIFNNSTIDLDTGKYIYKSGILTRANLSNVIKFGQNAYSATDGGNSVSNAYISILNRWGNNGVDNGLSTSSDSTERYITLKVNTFLPIKGAYFNIGFGRDSSFKFQISADNSTRTSLLSGTASETSSQNVKTNILNGLTTFYIRFYKSTVSNYMIIRFFEMEIDLDTSSLSVGTLYPTKRNQFLQNFYTKTNVASYVFRISKYKNEFNCFVPAIELNDASGGTGNAVGYIPLKIDNSLENAPSIKIFSDSGIASDTILTDGQSVNLSSPSNSGKIKYLVGQGANCDNITKNLILASVNGDNTVSTDGPSNQTNILIGIKTKGLGGNQNEIQEKINQISSSKLGIKNKNNFVNTKETLKIGNYSFWVDSTGKLKMMQGNPSADTDGSYV